jgi:hypothetical protein
MQKRKWLAELGELRAIFKDCLPIGEDTKVADDYFNRLEKVICTNDYRANPDPLGREDFEHDNPDVQYTYISDALFKERSGGPEHPRGGQDVDYQPDVDQGQVPQLGGPVFADYAPIPECEEDCDFEHGEESGDHPGW